MKLNAVEKIRVVRREIREIDQATKKIVSKIREIDQATKKNSKQLYEVRKNARL